MPELKLENSIVDDRYLTERCLGRGSFAEIFLAYDERRQGEAVIIKALNTTLQGTPDEELELTLVENFQNEAMALDKVRHPHIIRRLGHGTAADLRGVPFHYLVLEYMPGGDLLSLCRKRAFKLDDAIFYFKQVAEALAHAHSQRVIHRDIKPNNLLLSEDHRIIKIADFGVAKMTPDDTREITRVGTNVYAPPEHHPDTATDALGEKLTPSADVYSLAKTIYTAMTGRAPRQFSRLSITELPVELRLEPWSDQLLAVLKRATEPRVADRYQSVQEFWEQFARLAAVAAVGRAADAEATIVRARLGGASAVGRAAPQPNFQAPPSVPSEGLRAQKARIVVELPERKPQQHSENSAAKIEASAAVASRPPDQSGARLKAKDPLAEAQSAAAQPNNIIERNAAQLKTKRVAAVEDVERSFLDNVRGAIGSEWLRRIFIIFLIAALAGLVASTYYHFAGQKRGLPPLFNLSKEAVVSTRNLSLRSEPTAQSDVLAWLPAGTRVRVLNSRDGWARVKVVRWEGSPPADAPDGGWVSERYIQYD